MATIDFRRAHTLSHSRVRALAENLARRLEARHAVQWKWQGESLELIAPPGPAQGAKGSVTLHERELHIEVALPFTLRPIKRIIETKLQSRIDAWLHNASAAGHHP